MTLSIYIHPRAAITSGFVDFGVKEFELNEKELAALTDDECEELIRLLEPGDGTGAPMTLGSSPTDFQMSCATFTQVQKALAHRAHQRLAAEKEAAQKAAQLDAEQRQRADALNKTPLELHIIETEEGSFMSEALSREEGNPYCEALWDRVSEELGDRRLTQRLREQEFAAMKKREKEAQVVREKLAFGKWIQQHGDENQKNRWKEGLLSAQDIRIAIRNQLFEDLETFERYERITPESVCECECRPKVTVRRDADVELSAVQYEKLARLREEAPKGSIVTPFRQLGECPECDCPAVTVYVAQVDVEWSGLKMTRVYGL